MLFKKIIFIRVVLKKSSLDNIFSRSSQPRQFAGVKNVPPAELLVATILLLNECHTYPQVTHRQTLDKILKKHIIK